MDNNQMLNVGDEVTVTVKDQQNCSGIVILTTADVKRSAGFDRCMIEVFDECYADNRMMQDFIDAYEWPQVLLGKLYVLRVESSLTLVRRAREKPSVSCGSSDQGLFLSGAKKYTNAPRDPNSGLKWL